MEWITENLPGTKSGDRQKIQLTIESYLDGDRPEELREYLVNVLTYGIKQANRIRRREQWGSWWAYSWLVLVGCIRVAVVLALFSAAESKFQTIVFAALVLIYDGLRTGFSAASYWTMLTRFAATNQFTRVRRLLQSSYLEQNEERDLRTPRDGGEPSLARAAAYLMGKGADSHMERNEQQSLRREGVSLFINNVLWGVVSLIAIWKLVYSLFLD